MAKSRSFAQDVTQEVFLNVLENARRFDSAKGSVRAWLFGCARYVTLDRLRLERRWTDEHAGRGSDASTATSGCSRTSASSDCTPRSRACPSSIARRSCCASCRSCRMRRRPPCSGVRVGTVRSRLASRPRAARRDARRRRAARRPTPGRAWRRRCKPGRCAHERYAATASRLQAELAQLRAALRDGASAAARRERACALSFATPRGCARRARRPRQARRPRGGCTSRLRPSSCSPWGRCWPPCCCASSAPSSCRLRPRPRGPRRSP